ncbi:hypothetical protein HX798_26880 [Pseudomonas putida]|uniref:Uncharacterized protein n=1 Tax=Pseudomonas putida TaxID=303 RepID=A0A7Y8D5U3_PSEPU|nr:hypothetical protein [Pseudomonas putida]NWC83883.1 hypothetical protein [Pseudomonas putida]
MESTIQFHIATSNPFSLGDAAGYEGFFVTKSSDAQGPALGSFLTYHVALDEPGEFYADVRDAYGKTVFEIDGSVSQSGVMVHGWDVLGLKRHLVQLGVMTASQELVLAHETPAPIIVRRNGIGVDEFFGSEEQAATIRVGVTNFGHLLKRYDCQARRYSFSSFADCIEANCDPLNRQAAEVAKTLREVYRLQLKRAAS